jgi:hypothetical protein
MVVQLVDATVKVVVGTRWATYVNHLLRVVLDLNSAQVVVPFVLAAIYSILREIAVPIFAAQLAPSYECVNRVDSAIDLWFNYFANVTADGNANGNASALELTEAFGQLQNFVVMHAREMAHVHMGNLTGFACVGSGSSSDTIDFWASVLMAGIQYFTLTNTMTIIGLYVVALRRYSHIARTFKGFTDSARTWAVLPEQGGFFLSREPCV